MLRINKQKKLAILAIALTTLVIPVIAVTVNKINSVEDTFATGMPSGFNDQNFYNCVLAAFQTEYPGETVASSGLTDTQLAKIVTLNCYDENKPESEKIINTDGLNKMTGLEYLNLENNKIAAIDTSQNTELSRWVLSSNELTELDVSCNNKLTSLYASKNQIASLGRQGLDNNMNLVELSLYQNQLSNIRVNNNINLEFNINAEKTPRKSFKKIKR